ncbi:MAG: hypothetical protein IPP72_12835 [Chitinophagaceae bacterium]|nr:hypothetical protein [Chitinophagaceae bacterium]
MKLTADYSKLFKLCLWSLQLPEIDYVTLNKPPIENTARWQIEWFLNNEIKKLIEAKMDLFEEGKSVAFKVPVRIKETTAIRKFASLKCLWKKDELLREADAHFVRGEITITGQGKRAETDLYVQ